MSKKTQENQRFFLLSSGYCLLRFKVSLGDENDEKPQENRRFLIGLGYCLTRFRVSLGEENVLKPKEKTTGF